MIQSNPMLQQMTQNNPMMAQMLADPQLLQMSMPTDEDERRTNTHFNKTTHSTFYSRLVRRPHHTTPPPLSPPPPTNRARSSLVAARSSLVAVARLAARARRSLRRCAYM